MKQSALKHFARVATDRAIVEFENMYEEGNQEYQEIPKRVRNYMLNDYGITEDTLNLTVVYMREQGIKGVVV